MGNRAAAPEFAGIALVAWPCLARSSMILFAYASPARQWIKQSGTAGHQKQVLSELTKENRGLKHRLRALRDPGALEREARRLGMVRQGERSYVIENLP